MTAPATAPPTLFVATAPMAAPTPAPDAVFSAVVQAVSVAAARTAITNALIRLLPIIFRSRRQRISFGRTEFPPCLRPNGRTPLVSKLQRIRSRFEYFAVQAIFRKCRTSVSGKWKVQEMCWSSTSPSMQAICGHRWFLSNGGAFKKVGVVQSGDECPRMEDMIQYQYALNVELNIVPETYGDL